MDTQRTNYRKHTHTLYPREPELSPAGVRHTSHMYGHASRYGAGLRVYDPREKDRPVVVLIRNVNEAQEIINMMWSFIDQTQEGDTSLDTGCDCHEH